MCSVEIDNVLEGQKGYFQSGATLPVLARIENLKKLYNAIQEKEGEIVAALKADLGKSGFESYLCEIGMALSELTYLIKHIKKWAKPKRVHTPIGQFASKSYHLPTPYGNVLIVSPWNYPFLLTIDPIAAAIAAGNTVVVKPSAYSPATSKVLETLLAETFPAELVAVVTGGRTENAALLEKKFDKIFFTGSQTVGKEVLRRAAEHLTPVVLELGGKSPCIVDETAKIPLTARRIVFGKYLNCGQTCVAPDYILCHSSIKKELLSAIVREIKAQFGENPLQNSHYGHIVNRKHFDRICGLIDEGKIAFGGGRVEMNNKIEPTVLDNVTGEDPVRQEEIFGPVLLVLTEESLDEGDAF